MMPSRRRVLSLFLSAILRHVPSCLQDDCCSPTLLEGGVLCPPSTRGGVQSRESRSPFFVRFFTSKGWLFWKPWPILCCPARPGGAGVRWCSFHRCQSCSGKRKVTATAVLHQLLTSVWISCPLLSAHSPSDDIKAGSGARSKAPILPPRGWTHKTERRRNYYCFNEILPVHLTFMPRPPHTQAPPC